MAYTDAGGSAIMTVPISGDGSTTVVRW